MPAIARAFFTLVTLPHTRHPDVALVTLNEVKGPVKSCITKKRPVRFARDACCWSVDVFLSDYKLDCFETKSPTFVGLFMDKKSMLRNGVENFRAC